MHTHEQHDEELTAAPTRTHSALATSQQCHVVAMWPGGSATKELPPGARLTVGRSTRCDLVIDHPSVSREHAVFHGGPPATVEDLGSTNGTSINGIRAPKRGLLPIESGEVVTVGAAVLVLCGNSIDAPSLPRARSHPGGGAAPIVLDPAMKEIHRVAELVARGTLAVVLLGETGVGKEVLAATIHRASPRAGSAFVRVNCAALPETLLESELFGHERGSFTGATQAKPGLLETAHGGTVFFDEIGELPLSMQAKLLHALETREVTRIGAVKPRVIDVRYLAATNRDLAALVREGRFRQDLYFRLNGLSLTLPPLRKRPTEIMPLAEDLVRAACHEVNRRALAIAPAARAWLLAHEWPGNVRELRNVVQRAVALCTSDAIEVEHLAPEIALDAMSSTPDSPATIPAPPLVPLKDVARSAASAAERERIAQAIERCGGNQTRAAKMLGISRRTLVSRLGEYGFVRPLKG